MNEVFREQVERVIQMSRDSGETWDLSPNDQAALTAVLQRMAVLDAQVDALLNAMRKVRAHTSYVNPTPELLQGLLQSIERIADGVLAAERIIEMSRDGVNVTDEATAIAHAD